MYEPLMNISKNNFAFNEPCLWVIVYMLKPQYFPSLQDFKETQLHDSLILVLFSGDGFRKWHRLIFRFQLFLKSVILKSGCLNISSGQTLTWFLHVALCRPYFSALLGLQGARKQIIYRRKGANVCISPAPWIQTHPSPSHIAPHHPPAGVRISRNLRRALSRWVEWWGPGRSAVG